MAAIVMLEAENGSGFEVEAEWVGCDYENTWRAMAKIWDAARQFVKADLCKMGLKRDGARVAREGLRRRAVILFHV